MPGKSYKWSTNLRDDSDAESDSETSPPPRKRIPTPKPQSLEEVVLAEAEQLGEQEKDERFTERREVIDIAEIEEGDVKFVENPFSIATRLANQRKRQKLLHDDLVDQEVVMSEKGGQKNKPSREPITASAFTPASSLPYTALPKPRNLLRGGFAKQATLLPPPAVQSPRRAAPAPPPSFTIPHTPPIAPPVAKERKRSREIIEPEIVIFEDHAEDSSVFTSSNDLIVDSPPRKVVKYDIASSPATSVIVSSPISQKARLAKFAHRPLPRSSPSHQSASRTISSATTTPNRSASNPFMKSSSVSTFKLTKPFTRPSFVAPPRLTPSIPTTPSHLESRDSSNDWSTMAVNRLIPQQSRYGSNVFEPSTAYRSCPPRGDIGNAGTNPTISLSTKLARPRTPPPHVVDNTRPHIPITPRSNEQLKATSTTVLSGNRRMSLFTPSESLEEFKERTARTQTRGVEGGKGDGGRGTGMEEGAREIQGIFGVGVLKATHGGKKRGR